MTRVARVLVLTAWLVVTGVAPAAAGSAVHAPPVAGTWDVVVYGATPAGISAAIAAGRQGRRVVLVEPTAHIGGMMTSGLGMSDIGSKDAIGGLARGFFKRLGVAYQVPDGQPSWTLTPRMAERTFAAMLATAHVKVVTGQRLREPVRVSHEHPGGYGSELETTLGEQRHPVPQLAHEVGQIDRLEAQELRVLAARDAHRSWAAHRPRLALWPLEAPGRAG